MSEEFTNEAIWAAKIVNASHRTGDAKEVARRTVTEILARGRREERGTIWRELLWCAQTDQGRAKFVAWFEARVKANGVSDEREDGGGVAV